IEPAIALREGHLSALEAAVAGRTTRTRIERLAASNDLVGDLLGPLPEADDELRARIRATLGQLMIGRMAEQVFEHLWLSALGDEDLRLRDDRVARTDTDFLVEDSSGHHVFRLNIKFHGATFR